MKPRKWIEDTCKKFGLEIDSLVYDKHIGYDTGGWELTVKDPYEPGRLIEYVGHKASHIVSDLEIGWYPANQLTSTQLVNEDHGRIDVKDQKETP